MRKLFVVLTMSVLAGATALAGDAGAGKAIYTRSCQSCHGPDGVAKPAIVKMMKVEMKDLGSAEVQALSDDAIKKIITEGQGKMKAAKSLSAKEVDDVVACVRSLQK